MAGTGKEECRGLPHPGSGLGGPAVGIDRSEVDFDPLDCVQPVQDRQCNSKCCDAVKNMLLRRDGFGAFVQFCVSVSKHVKVKVKVLPITSYAVGSKSFRPDIQKTRQMENAVRDI